MSDLGDHSLDLPYEANPPGQFITDGFAVSGGLIIAASVVPIEGENRPALIFRFATPHGQFYAPILLVLDDDQAAKLPELISKSVGGAIAAAKEAA